VATELTLSNGNRRTLLDLKSGKPRKTVYFPHNPVIGPLGIAMIGLGLAAVAPGIYRMFTGPTERAQAVERLKIDQLEAKLNHDTAKIAKLDAETQRILLAASPSIVEEREARTRTIQENLPLDLWRKEVTNAALELELQLNREIAPVIARIKQQTADNLDDQNEQRWQAHETALDLAQVTQDRIEADTERFRAVTEQTELQTRLLETAVDGMDFFSKQIFIRDRLFPQREEPKRGFISPTGIRTITAF